MDNDCPVCGKGTTSIRLYNETIDLRFGPKLYVTNLKYLICDTCGSEMVGPEESRYNKRRIDDAKQQLYRRTT